MEWLFILGKENFWTTLPFNIFIPDPLLTTSNPTPFFHCSLSYRSLLMFQPHLLCHHHLPSLWFLLLTHFLLFLSLFCICLLTKGKKPRRQKNNDFRHQTPSLLFNTGLLSLVSVTVSPFTINAITAGSSSVSYSVRVSPPSMSNYIISSSPISDSTICCLFYFTVPIISSTQNRLTPSFWFNF